MMGKMCGVHKVAWILLLIGGVNWLLVGLLEKDLFVLLGMGMDDMIARAVYILVGVSAFALMGVGKCCAFCGHDDCKDCASKAMGKGMEKKQ